MDCNDLLIHFPCVLFTNCIWHSSKMSSNTRNNFDANCLCWFELQWISLQSTAVPCGRSQPSKLITFYWKFVICGNPCIILSDWKAFAFMHSLLIICVTFYSIVILLLFEHAVIFIFLLHIPQTLLFFMCVSSLYNQLIYIYILLHNAYIYIFNLFCLYFNLHFVIFIQGPKLLLQYSTNISFHNK